MLGKQLKAMVNFEIEMSRASACQGLSGRYGTPVWYSLSVT